jgi:hypothetical protein
VSVVAIDAPLGVRLFGLKLQLDPEGCPEQLNVTVGLKVASGLGVTVRLVWTLCPWTTERLDWLAVTVKSTTAKATGDDEELA